MGSLYSIDCLKGREDLKSDIVISTIQKLFKVEPVLYVVNGWNRFSQTRDFLDWFYTKVDRYAPLVSVAQSDVFGQAWARDSSVVAYAPTSHVTGDVLRLVNLVRRTCGFSDE